MLSYAMYNSPHIKTRGKIMSDILSRTIKADSPFKAWCELVRNIGVYDYVVESWVLSYQDFSENLSIGLTCEPVRLHFDVRCDGESSTVFNLSGEHSVRFNVDLLAVGCLTPDEAIVRSDLRSAQYQIVFMNVHTLDQDVVNCTTSSRTFISENSARVHRAQLYIKKIIRIIEKDDTVTPSEMKRLLEHLSNWQIYLSSNLHAFRDAHLGDE